MNADIENFLTSEIPALIGALKAKAGKALPAPEFYSPVVVRVHEDASSEVFVYDLAAEQIQLTRSDVERAPIRVDISSSALEWIYECFETYDITKRLTQHAAPRELLPQGNAPAMSLAGEVVLEGRAVSWIRVWINHPVTKPRFTAYVKADDLWSTLAGRMNVMDLALGRIRVEGDATEFMQLMLSLASQL